MKECKKVVFLAVVLTMCLGIGAVAHAAVTLDDQGVGFVGKGDVQSAFDWNNAQLQANAGRIGFLFTSSMSTSWQCEKTVQTKKETRTLVQNRHATQTISSSIAFDSRKNNLGKITGFNLNGVLESAAMSVDGPQPGSCPEEPHNPTNSGWAYVYGSEVVTDVDAGTLRVCFSGACEELTITQ